ncbi:MAG: hypothetical protein JWR61_5341 [Ferruginibacter sp.]|uniref:peptidoglycan bridge formation glycyltransferase FemA/FemB family protein n=1 Tax=Ferruginibacter sp. TaxID=1940288 RepID=UPI0026586EB4|nr:peptidoglycan bridge formation glycyltransferase FemA/FemB family protein [Ferruginibacter sp.]MDB5280386.1 hypothetical protein [Ferruginibacter sp.]
MIKYYKKKSFLQIEECWFDGAITFKDLFSLKVIYHNKNSPSFWGIKETTHTLELDLEQEKEQILANFSKAYRQQIRKAEEEGITVESTSNIEEFVAFFNEFASKKGTYSTSRQRILEKKNYLQMSFAKHQNSVIAAQSFLVDEDKKIIRHYQTANKRFDDSLNKNFVGYANKFLLVTNIMRFKEEGYKIFDFGGYAANTTDPSLLGINNYKLKFGGTVVECKDYYSIPFWLMRKTAKLFGLNGTV